MHNIGGSVVAEYPRPPDKNSSVADVVLFALFLLSTPNTVIDVTMVTRGNNTPIIAHIMCTYYLSLPEVLNISK